MKDVRYSRAFLALSSSPKQLSNSAIANGWMDVASSRLESGEQMSLISSSGGTNFAGVVNIVLERTSADGDCSDEMEELVSASLDFRSMMIVLVN